jgi:hypothetical protein
MSDKNNYLTGSELDKIKKLKSFLSKERMVLSSSLGDHEKIIISFRNSRHKWFYVETRNGNKKWTIGKWYEWSA